MFRNLLRWARIVSPGTDDKQFATQQMEYRGKIADGLIVFPYGLHGNVPADALALMFAVGGDPENRAAIAWTPKDRPQLAGGEVAFYHPPTDGWIIWRESGDLEIITGNNGGGNVSITCKNATVTASENVGINCAQANITASESATIDTPETTITGNLSVGGDATVTGTVEGGEVQTAGGIVLSSHIHSGVTAGGANSGPPV